MRQRLEIEIEFDSEKFDDVKGTVGSLVLIPVKFVTLKDKEVNEVPLTVRVSTHDVTEEDMREYYEGKRPKTSILVKGLDVVINGKKYHVAKYKDGCYDLTREGRTTVVREDQIKIEFGY